MTPAEFVLEVRTSIVDENVAIYRALLDGNPAKEASDPYWKSLQQLYARLPVTDRETFFAVMRQVSVDTVSNVLGVIDGSIRLHGQGEDLELRETKSLNNLSGTLQDIFLEMEEKDTVRRDA